MSYRILACHIVSFQPLKLCNLGALYGTLENRASMKALKFMTTRKPITTDRSISSHKAEEKEYHVSVKGFSNLYLLVRPNKTKSWIFRYMSPTTSKRDKISFDIYPNVSLSRACELWHEYSEILSKNISAMPMACAQILYLMILAKLYHYGDIWI